MEGFRYCTKCQSEIPVGESKCPVCDTPVITVGTNKKKKKDGLFGGGRVKPEKKVRPSKRKNIKKQQVPFVGENGEFVFGNPDNTGDGIDGGAGRRTGGGAGRHTGDGRKRVSTGMLVGIIAGTLAVVLIIAAAIILPQIVNDGGSRVGPAPTDAPSDLPTVAPTSEPTTEPTGVEPTAPTDSTEEAETAGDSEDVDSDETTQEGVIDAAQSSVDQVETSFVHDTDQSFFLPDSGTRLYTVAEIRELNNGVDPTTKTLKLVRAEIYARAGYIFKNKTFKDYFSKKKWYNEKIAGDSFSDSNFSYYQLENVRMLDTYIKETR